MGIEKIGQIGVPVRDLEQAIKFYRDVLELPLLFNVDSLAFFDCNGVRLLLSLPEKEEFAYASSIIYYQVENIQNQYHLLKEKGVHFLDEPHVVAKMGQVETWMVFLKDTEGNTLALISEVEV